MIRREGVEHVRRAEFAQIIWPCSVVAARPIFLVIEIPSLIVVIDLLIISNQQQRDL